MVERTYSEWQKCSLNATKAQGNSIACAYGIEIEMFKFLPTLEVTSLQALNRFYYESVVTRAQGEKIKMNPPMRFYFTSPSDQSFQKRMIEYRCKTGICPDRFPAGRFQTDDK